MEHIRLATVPRIILTISRALKESEEEKKLGKRQGVDCSIFLGGGTEEDSAACFWREDEKIVAMRSQDEAYKKHQHAIFLKKLQKWELS